MAAPICNKRKVVAVGNYKFTGLTLGKGNFARVEQAEHALLNIKVAVKVMDVSKIQEEYVIRNLYREARIMSKLNHPCIAALYQTMQRPDNVYYIVTELVSGGDMCNFVKSQANGRLEERSSKTFGRQFASAIMHMHSIGVVHRDLKMENVMLNTGQTQIKIVDFGLSNAWRPESPLKTHCGSPEYAAPELFVTGRQYGPEVDMWSLGIILYGMVMGHLPFVSTKTNDGQTSQERRKRLVAQINKGLSSTHRRAISCFSLDFRSLLNGLLEADSSKRLSAKELIVHPWITDKGKKIIRSNPIKAVSAFWQSKAISEISTLTHTDIKTVIKAIREEPLGKLGGIFNILLHQYQLHKLHGNGIVKRFPSLSLMKNDGKKERTVPHTDKPSSATQKKPDAASRQTRRSQRPQTHQCIKRPTDTITQVSSRALLKNCIEPIQQQDELIPSKRMDKHKISPLFEGLRMNTDQSCYYNRTNAIKHGPLQNYSSPSRLGMKHDISKPKTAPAPKSILTRTTAVNELDEHRSNTMRSPHQNQTRKEKIVPLMDYRNIKSPALRRKAYSATITPTMNRLFTPNIKAETAEKGSLAVANRPAAQSRDGTETVDVYSIRNVISQRRGKTASGDDDRHHGQSHNLSKPSSATYNKRGASGSWEKPSFAYGDTKEHTTADPCKAVRKNKIYDPIARSIAEYVYKNVPAK